MQTYFPSLFFQRLRRVTCLRGERVRIATDWRGIGTVSSSVWYVDSQGLIELSSEHLAASTADVLMRCDGVGLAIVENVVTFSDGQKRSQQYEVQITFALRDDSLLCPLQLTPSDGATATTSETLTWGAIVGATSYDLYLWESDGPVPTTPTVTTTELSYDATGLTPGVSYTWRVNATDEANSSTGCGTRDFEIGISSVQFTASLYPSGDAPNSVTVSVSRTGPNDSACSVHYATADGTAIAGVNYTSTSGTLNWAAGDSANKTFDVAILAGEVTESDLTVVLSSPVDCVIGSPNPATITIPLVVTFNGALAYRATLFSTSFFEQVAQWDAEVYDLANWHNPTATPPELQGRFTTSGAALVRSAVNHSSLFVPEILFDKNGSPVIGGAAATAGTSSIINAVSAILAVAPGDYIESRTFVDIAADKQSWQSVEEIASDTQYALVYKSSSVSFPAGNGIISWDSEVADVGGWHNGTNPTRMTVPAGVSLVKVSACLDFGDNISSYPNLVYIAVIKNGVAFDSMAARLQERGSEIRLCASTGPIEVTPGDYFEVYATIGNTVLLNNSSYTWFCIEECPIEQKGALVKKSASQSFTSGVRAAVAFDAEIYDAIGAHSNVTNNTRLTVPSGANWARLSFNVRMPDSGTPSGIQYAQVYRNGLDEVGLPADSCQAVSSERLNATGAWVIVTPGDYFELKLTTGADVTLTADNANWFCMEVRA